MNRIEITEELAELREARVSWIKENEVPVSEWLEFPKQGRMAILGELLENCYNNYCECGEEVHELTGFSNAVLNAHFMKTQGDFTGLVAVQKARMEHVSNEKTRERMEREIDFLKVGAVRVDKAELNWWKREAKNGCEIFQSILDIRQMGLNEKNERRNKGEIICI